MAIEVCVKGSAPEFDIPKDKTAKDRILEILGYEEIEISETDENGNTVRAYILGRIEEG